MVLVATSAYRRKFFSWFLGIKSIYNLALHIRARHWHKLLKVKSKPWIKNFMHARCQQPDWGELKTSDVSCSPKPTDWVEVRHTPSVSVRCTVHHTNQTLWLPVHGEDNSYVQRIANVETNRYAIGIVR